MNIPPADSGKWRQITPHIRTQLLPTRMVMAQYRDVRDYKTPLSAVPFARMGRNSKTKAWAGEIVLQDFASGAQAEAEALRFLLINTEKLCPGSLAPEEAALAAAICALLSAAPAEQLGAPRVRRKRTKWRDANGKRVAIYVDTQQRFAHLPARTPETDPIPDQDDPE